MGFWELLVKRMRKYYGQGIILTVFGFLFSGMILGCIAAYSVTVYGKEHIGESMDGKVQVKSCEGNDERSSCSEGQMIEYELAKQLVDDERVADYDMVSMAGVHGRNVTHMLLMDETMDQEDANGNLTLICQRKMLDHAVFKDRGNSIIAGRAIKEDEQGSVAVVSKTFAEQNAVSTGDWISLESLNGEEINLEIVGISSYIYQGNIVLPVRMAEYNQIFTTKEIVDRANGLKNLYQVTYTMRDCGDADFFLQDIKRQLDSTEYIFHVYNTEYHMALSAIVNYQTTIFMLIEISVVMGCFIIGLFAVYSLTGHLKDIGILYSLGIKRCSIIAQYLVELLLPVFMGNILCLLLFEGVKGVLTDILKQKVSFVSNVEIRLEWEQLMVYFSCGIVMTLLSAGYICFKVIKSSPRELLTESK